MHHCGFFTHHSTYSASLLIASCWSKIIVIFQPLGLKSYNIMKCLRKRGGGDGLCIYIFLSGAQGSVQCMGGLLNQMLSHLNNLLCTLESVCVCVCSGVQECQQGEMSKYCICPLQSVFVRAVIYVLGILIQHSIQSCWTD